MGPNMFDKATAARHCTECQVIITVNGQEPFEGVVFVRIDERVSDLLNDARAFLPVRRPDGSTIFLSKSAIATLIEIPAPASKRTKGEDRWAKTDEFANGHGPGGSHPEDGERRAPRSHRTSKKKLDPYEVLRVSPSATLEEIRKAYKARIRAVHPDTLAALDLDEDLERAANITAQKVNHAYHRIMCERERAKEPHPAQETGAA